MPSKDSKEKEEVAYSKSDVSDVVKAVTPYFAKHEEAKHRPGTK